MPRITAQEIYEIRERSLPWAGMMARDRGRSARAPARVRLPPSDRFLRPGGTVNGPALMSLADDAMYVAVLSAIGRVEMAVTTSLNCNFLRRPKPGAVIAECRLIKLGKRPARGEVSLYSGGAEAEGPVAPVTATYSIPPERDGG